MCVDDVGVSSALHQETGSFDRAGRTHLPPDCPIELLDTNCTDNLLPQMLTTGLALVFLFFLSFFYMSPECLCSSSFTTAIR